MLLESLQQRFNALNKISSYERCTGCGVYQMLNQRTMCRDCCLARCSHVWFGGIIIAANGAKQPWRRCITCGLLATTNTDVAALPLVFRDLRNKFDRPCQRCGARDGVEFHHWAPRAIFADADDWPLGLLCRPCHQFWHQTMRRAGGYKLDVPIAVEAGPVPVPTS